MVHNELPAVLESVFTESKEVKVPRSVPPNPRPLDPKIVERRTCEYLNKFTAALQSQVLLSVQALHLPKASVHVEGVSESRPLVGQVEALCFFIGLAAAQLNPKGLSLHPSIYNRLRPKFLAFTNRLVAFQTRRKEVESLLWKKVNSLLSSLEEENKDQLQVLYGEEEPDLGPLHSLTPIPPPNLSSSIWEEHAGAEGEPSTAPENLLTFSWNVWHHDVLEVDHHTSDLPFPYSGMTFRSRGKILHTMMDQALRILEGALGHLEESKASILDAGRILINIRTFLHNLDSAAAIRPEQTYVILRTLRSRLVGVEMYLGRTEAVLRRCRFFLSHGIRHIRAHLHEIQSFDRDFGDNPFHYLTLKVQLKLGSPMGVVRHELDPDAANEPEETENQPEHDPGKSKPLLKNGVYFEFKTKYLCISKVSENSENFCITKFLV
jgi:hypothetical protein